MKYFLFLLLPIFSHAQINVIKKPIRIATLGSGEWSSFLSRIVVDSDTTYQYIFRDNFYSSIIVTKSIVFTKSGLKDFSQGLKTSVAGDLSQEVWVSHIGITKEHGALGSSGYKIYYDNAGQYLKPKDVNKLISIIDAE